MKLFKLEKVLFVFKNQPELLLKGISTNTLDSPKNAYVNRNGKIIAITDQVLKENALYVVVDEYARAEFEQMLKLYLPLVPTTYEVLPHDVYYSLDGSYDVENSDLCFIQEHGALIATTTSHSSVLENEFILYRVENRIPLHGKDFTDEMLLDVFEEGCVSYTKGCFTGQEILARVHNLASPKKKLSVVVKSDIYPDLTSSATCEDGVERGFALIPTN